MENCVDKCCENAKIGAQNLTGITETESPDINPQMKMTVGMGSIDDFIPFVSAGADEIFCGYVPMDYMVSGGLDHPFNRREVLYVNVQSGSFSEMEILAHAAAHYHIPVTLTLNSPSYPAEMYGKILETVEKLCEIGLDTFIVADPDMLKFLSEERRKALEQESSQRVSALGKLKLHVSGEYGEISHFMMEGILTECGILGGCGSAVTRFIFQRKTSPEDMKLIIEYMKREHPEVELEYEAFALNELCQYSGSYCSTLHCDEMAPMCRVPYRLGRVKKERAEDADAVEQEMCDTDSDDYCYIPGASGCGLCALWRLRDAGVTHLKVVSRGNYSEDTENDIRTMKKALRILEDSKTEEEYICEMKRRIFPKGCSGNCYYL